MTYWRARNPLIIMANEPIHNLCSKQVLSINRWIFCLSLVIVPGPLKPNKTNHLSLHLPYQPVLSLRFLYNRKQNKNKRKKTLDCSISSELEWVVGSFYVTVNFEKTLATGGVTYAKIVRRCACLTFFTFRILNIPIFCSISIHQYTHFLEKTLSTEHFLYILQNIQWKLSAVVCD